MGATPFGIEGLSNAYIQLKQTGTEMDEMTSVIGMLGDTAGGSAEKFNRLVANYAQIQSVGKTTAMDLKQFAMMGLPIYDVLRDIGVQGNATADQVQTAFEIMTSEGGSFYNAMSRGSETLAGKLTMSKDAFKEWRATWAETTGITDTWKNALDLFSQSLENSTNKMRDAQTQAAKNKVTAQLSSNFLQGDGSLSGTETLEELQYMYDLFVAYKYDQKEMYQEQMQELVSQMNILEQRAAQAERQKRAEEEFLELVKQTNSNYSEGLMRIEGAYYDTSQGQKQAIQDEIESWEELLSIKQMVAYSSPNGQYKGYSEIGIDEATKEKVYAIIEGLKEKLEGLDKKAKDNTKTWQEWWNEITGGTISNTQKGAEAAQLYIDGVTQELEQNKAIAEVLGKSFDITGFLEKKTEEAEKQIMSLLTIKSDKIVNGESFELIDKSINGIITLYQKLAGELKAVTEQEEERARAQKSAEIVEGLNKQIELLKAQGNERAKILALQSGITEADLGTFLMLEKQIEELEVQRDLYGQIELAKKRALEDGDMGAYAGAMAAETGMNAIQGSEVGAFIQGTIKTGDPMGGLVDMLAADFAFLLGEVNGLSYALSPLRGLISGFTPAIKELLTPILRFSFFLTLAGEKLAEWLGKEYEMGAEWDKIVAAMDKNKDKQEELGDETDKQLRQLQELNKQYKNLTMAMKDQEDYYLEQKRDLMSSTLSDLISAQKVNDLVITRDGKTFVTDNADSIIATKNPESLGSGSGAVNISIVNNAGAVVAEVTRNTENNGTREIVIELSKQIAVDYAVGANGWANARKYAQAAGAGRNISI